MKILYGSIIIVEADPFDTIEIFKAKIQNNEGIPFAQQELLLDNRPLEDSCTLSYYKICSEDTLLLVIRSKG